MKMVSMKRAEDGDYMSPVSAENYGYGLCLVLNEDQCEALGITSAMKPGTQVSIKAQAIVVSSGARLERDGDDKGNDITMSMQITDMGVEAGGVMRNAAAVLYGKE